MDIEEFIEYVDIEGLEYYLTCKNTDWYFLQDKELLAQCHKLVEASNKIHNIIEANRTKFY